jgi:hypothetical protein
VKSLRERLVLVAALLLAGCSSERHFAVDSVWPFGNPNGPVAGSETAQRALGHTADVTPIAPQAGNVWPGPVQPVPTISDEQKAMNEPLGNAYTPSLPSPYPPGMTPPPDPDLGSGPLGAPGTQSFSTPANLAPDSPDLAAPGGQDSGAQSGTVSGPYSSGGTSGAGQ